MRPLALITLIAAVLVLTVGADAQPPAVKAKPDPKKVDPKAKIDPEPKLNMKMTVAEIRLGKSILGAKVESSDLKDKVVLLDYWGVNCPPCLAAMPRTAELNAELGEFGLLVLGSHVQGGNEEDVRAVALKHHANFPISIQTRVRGTEDYNGLPHCVLFDHTGKCLFRGLPTEVDLLVRKAVGNAIIANAGREKFTSAIEPILKALRAGKSPATILPRVAAMRNFAGDAGADAKGLLAAMTAGGRKKLERAESVISSDPVEAFILVETLPAVYKGSPLATEASEMLSKLRKEKSVTTEVNARQALEGVKKLDQQLNPGAQDPKKPEFQKANAPLLKQLKNKTQQMKKSWPDARATKEALETAERYAVEIK